VPIPDLDESGFLPAGVHACTVEEIGARFGRFQGTSQRPELFARLQTYLREAGDARVAKAAVVDGSFITAEERPNDVDLITILTDDYDFRAQLRPFQYNILSTRRVRMRFGFDVLVARDNSPEYAEYVAFFQQVRGRPGLQKGLLRVEL
jgi:hypothetical protein